jgi:hypothetical protein
MLKLENVTLLIVDCLNHEAALLSLEQSMSRCQFKEVVFITDLEPKRNVDKIIFRIIPKIKSRIEYSKFILNNLIDYFKTDFVLIIQWDGYVVNQESWSEDFLKYDYIGAKWWHKDGANVGNGGFSLRTRKLVEAVKSLNIDFKSTNGLEDDIICRLYRKELENKYGILFASESIADQFSTERCESNNKLKPFGFHGYYNLYKFISKDHLELILKSLPPKTITSVEHIELMQNLYTNKRYMECIYSASAYLTYKKDTNVLLIMYNSSLQLGILWLSAMAILQLNIIDPTNEVYRHELHKYKSYL